MTNTDTVRKQIKEMTCPEDREEMTEKTAIQAIECFECRESFIWRRLEKGEKRIVTCPHCETRHKLWQQKKNNILRVTNLKYK